MPDTSHFFHRRLIDLRGAIKNGVRPYLPPECRKPRKAHERTECGSKRACPEPGQSPSAAYAAGVARGEWSDDPRAACLRCANSTASTPRCSTRASVAARRTARQAQAASAARPVPVGRGRARQDVPDRPVLRRVAGAAAASAARISTASCARCMRSCACTPASAIRWRDRARLGPAAARAGARRVLRQRHRRRDAARPPARAAVRRGRGAGHHVQHRAAGSCTRTACSARASCPPSR